MRRAEDGPRAPVTTTHDEMALDLHAVALTPHVAHRAHLEACTLVCPNKTGLTETLLVKSQICRK